MRTRAVGAVLMACAVALFVLPAFAWYSAAVPHGRVDVRGLAVSGVLWLVPALAVPVAVAGAFLVAVRGERRAAVARWAGPLALLAAVMALAASVWAGFDGAVLTAVAEGVSGPLDVPLRSEPAAWMTPAAAMVAAVGALWLTITAWRP